MKLTKNNSILYIIRAIPPEIAEKYLTSRSSVFVVYIYM